MPPTRSEFLDGISYGFRIYILTLRGYSACTAPIGNTPSLGRVIERFSGLHRSPCGQVWLFLRGVIREMWGRFRSSCSWYCFPHSFKAAGKLPAAAIMLYLHLHRSRSPLRDYPMAKLAHSIPPHWSLPVAPLRTGGRSRAARFLLVSR